MARSSRDTGETMSAAKRVSAPRNAAGFEPLVTALGGGGELVTDPADIGPALRRAFDSGIPYLVNVVTDPSDASPRSTTGV